MCFHLAKHLNSTGAGIRMVMDLALFLKAYQDTLTGIISGRSLNCSR